MKKLKIILSIAFLFVLSVIVGFMTEFNNKPLTPRSEYPILLITGTLAVMIVLGFMFWGVYAFCKKQEIGDPFKIAFWVYAFFGFCLFGIGAYQFKDSVNKRDNYEFLEFYAEEIEMLSYESADLELDRQHIKDEKTIGEVEQSVYSSFRFNTEYAELMRKSGSLETFFMTNPKVKEEVRFCIEYVKKYK